MSGGQGEEACSSWRHGEGRNSLQDSTADALRRSVDVCGEFFVPQMPWDALGCLGMPSFCA